MHRERELMMGGSNLIWIASFPDGALRIKAEGKRLRPLISPFPSLRSKLVATFGANADIKLLRALGGGFKWNATPNDVSFSLQHIPVLGLVSLSREGAWHEHGPMSLTSDEDEILIAFHNGASDLYSCRVESVAVCCNDLRLAFRKVPSVPKLLRK